MRYRRDGERGVVAVLTAIFATALLVFTAIAVDIATWYWEAARVQSAADAAALSGTVAMPDFTRASAKARSTSASNGYVDSVSGPVSVDPFQIPARPTELGVTVSSTIPNVFGKIFGNPETTITRTAVADYVGEAIMGSPCNALGNQPPSSSVGVQPPGTVIPTEAQGGYATCQSDTNPPNFWMNVAGPTTNKQNGDRYATKTGCSSAYRCTGTNNDEYVADGYFMVVRVLEDAVGRPINLQLYDPAFVYTGDKCESGEYLPDRTVSTDRAVRASGIITITTDDPHGFAPGQEVEITGMNTNANGTYEIDAVTSTTFSFDKAGTGFDDGNNGDATVTFDQVANPFAPKTSAANLPSAAERYAKNTDSSDDARTFCPGDQRLASSDHLNTSFVLRYQTDTENPLLAAPVLDTVGQPCTRQYASLRANSPTDSGGLVGPSIPSLSSGGTLYQEDLARLFHQWVDFCTFIPQKKGDYYLQVRTNIPLTSTQVGGNNFVRDGLISGVNQVAYPTTLDETGSGHNRFAVRAYIPGTIPSGANVGDAYASQVSVAGWRRMPIYANASGNSATFNLMQVLPNTAGKSFTFEAFDNGDATCSTDDPCTIQVSLPPDVAGGVTMGTCVGERFNASGTLVAPATTTAALGPCEFNITGNQGYLQRITVQIPPNYDCDNLSPGGCWYQVTARYQGSVTDTTTWDATIDGDVVRLVQ